MILQETTCNNPDFWYDVMIGAALAAPIFLRWKLMHKISEDDRKVAIITLNPTDQLECERNDMPQLRCRAGGRQD